jgi:hypothetical protein
MGFTREIRKVSLASETGVEERDGCAATASEVTEAQLPPKNKPAIGGFIGFVLKPMQPLPLAACS